MLNWKQLVQQPPGGGQPWSYQLPLSFRKGTSNAPGLAGLGSLRGRYFLPPPMRKEAKAEEENGLLKAKHKYKQISKLPAPC